MKTPIREKDAVAVAAAKLKRTAGPLWEEFEKAFNVYAATVKDTAIQAPADKVMVAQGRAQQCVELSTLFSEAISTADKIAAGQQK